jgi:hypothetical protein
VAVGKICLVMKFQDIPGASFRRSEREELSWRAAEPFFRELTSDEIAIELSIQVLPFPFFPRSLRGVAMAEARTLLCIFNQQPRHAGGIGRS